MATVDVKPGVCGFNTHIVATADASFNVSIEITSECSHIRELAEQLTEVSVFEELRHPINETSDNRAAAICKVHVACPVPSAILKAIDVSAGIALPADVHMAIAKD